MMSFREKKRRALYRDDRYKIFYVLQNTYRGTTVVPALAAIIWADKAAFYDCNFVGYQDTLCDMSGRHYFKDCRIEGAVDFIFGIGQSIYEVNPTPSISLPSL